MSPPLWWQAQCPHQLQFTGVTPPPSHSWLLASLSVPARRAEPDSLQNAPITETRQGGGWGSSPLHPLFRMQRPLQGVRSSVQLC